MISSFRLHGLYNKILHVRIFYLYACTFLIIAFITAFWWYFLYQPALAEYVQSQKSIDQLHAHIATLHKSKHALASTAQSIVELKTRVQDFLYKKPRNQAMQTNLVLITDYAAGAGMNVCSCRFCNESDTSWCSINQITGEFKGSFDQIIAFFEALKKSKQVIDITKCDVARIDGNVFSLHAVFDLYYI